MTPSCFFLSMPGWHQQMDDCQSPRQDCTYLHAEERLPFRWTYLSPFRTSKSPLHHPRGTLVWDWTTSCAAMPTSPLWPDHVEFLSTTSVGSGPSSQVKQHRSWSKRSYSLTSNTKTLSWLDSQHPQSNPHDASRTQQRDLVFNSPKFSHVTPLFHDLHWLLVISGIRFKTLVLAYKAVSATAPTYRQRLVRPYAPA